MSELTVEQLAKQAGNVPLKTLFEQLRQVGVKVSSLNDVITDDQMQQVLALLNKEPRRVVVRRTEVSTIKTRGNKTVSVVRKRKIKDEALSETATETIPEVQHQSEVDLPLTGAEDNAQADVLTETVAQLNELVGAANNTNINLDKTTQKTVDNEDVSSDTDNGEDSAEGKKKIGEIKGNKKGKKLGKEEEAEIKPKALKAKQDKSKAKIKTNKLVDLVIDEDTESLQEEFIAKIPNQSFNNANKVSKRHINHGKETVKHNPHAFVKPTKPIVKEIVIPETIVVSDLAKALAIKASDLMKMLIKLGVMATINQTIDQDTAAIVVEELGHKVKLQKIEDFDAIHHTVEYGNQELVTRSPIVTVMGHVDHGKTSLLDYIRRTKVTAGEAGGITQHIGAYCVQTARGSMTFLDTPGHAAFTAMRARGAQCTDIVVLIVAADDGVKPQTLEALQHARAAEVPIIVAVNKIDKNDSDPEKVQNELAQHGLLSEDWGGDTMFVKVSARDGTGIDELLESINVQAELLELKAVADGPATGVVIEATLDKNKGPCATLLIQNGVLKKGDVIVAGKEYGKTRAMINDKGEYVDTALPSMPVEVLGLSSVPMPGDKFVVVASERKAREIAMFRAEKDKVEKMRKANISIDGVLQQMKQSQNEVKTLHLIIKADVNGSAEALKEELTKVGNEKVIVKVIHSGVGGFNESDVNLAIASNAILLGFNVRADNAAKALAQKEGIEIKYYSIIYDLIDDINSIVLGKVDAVVHEKIIGVAEVREVFRSAKLGAIAGCMVIEGIVKRNNPIRVLRDNIVIYEGELESLRRFKENVMEVKNGMECGIGVKNYNDVQVKDQIEVFEKHNK